MWVCLDRKVMINLHENILSLIEQGKKQGKRDFAEWYIYIYMTQETCLEQNVSDYCFCTADAKSYPLFQASVFSLYLTHSVLSLVTESAGYL